MDWFLFGVIILLTFFFALAWAGSSTREMIGFGVLILALLNTIDLRPKKGE